MKTTIMALLFTLTSSAFAKSEVKLIRAYKSERRLELVNKDNQVVKAYKIMLGKASIGHKVQEGDNKTPEGNYTLDQKNPKSNFNKSFHISYPNLKDKLKAKSLGVSPGGDIMLHGFPNNFKEMTEWLNSIGLGGISDDIIRASLPYFDWTSGCIAVTDDEINEIFEMVDVPTKITIFP